MCERNEGCCRGERHGTERGALFVHVVCVNGHRTTVLAPDGEAAIREAKRHMTGVVDSVEPVGHTVHHVAPECLVEWWNLRKHGKVERQVGRGG